MAKYMIIAGDGVLYYWGESNYYQMKHLLKDVRLRVHPPLQVECLGNVKITSTSTGLYHSMALCEDGKLFTWGSNSYGQLGNGKNFKGHKANRICPTPQQMILFEVIISISCGDEHSMALSEYGKVFSWGCNKSGQLGHGNKVSISTPQKIAHFHYEIINSISCGSEHSMALSEDGKVFSWGCNRYGQLGMSTTFLGSSIRPKRIEYPKNIISIACGGNHSMALTEEGKVYSCGYSISGHQNVGLPRQIPNLTNVKSISCGHFYNALALCYDGKLFSLKLERQEPLESYPKPTLENVTSISCVNCNSIALTKDDKLFEVYPETKQIELPLMNMRWNSSEIRPLIWQLQRVIWIAKHIPNVSSNELCSVTRESKCIFQ